MVGAGLGLKLRNAVNAVCHEIERNKFMAMLPKRRPNEEDLWWELVACILGSAVRYEQALLAVSRLREYGVTPWHTRLPEFRQRLVETLGGGDRCRHGGYPFARSRAAHIAKTAETLYVEGPSLSELLSLSSLPRKVRRNIIQAATGIGPKQASLFLRNIGFWDEFAVLDTHVLEFMYLTGLLDARVRTVPCLRTYERLEEAFRKDAEANGFGVGYYDVAVWVVMRVFKEERLDEPCDSSLRRR